MVMLGKIQTVPLLKEITMWQTDTNWFKQEIQIQERQQPQQEETPQELLQLEQEAQQTQALEQEMLQTQLLRELKIQRQLEQITIL